MTVRCAAGTSVTATLALALVAGCSTDPSFESGATSGSSSDAGSTSASGPTTGSGGDDTSSPASTGSSSGDGGGGATGSGSSTTTSGPTASSSVSAVSTGTGADCTTADDCADANPCTIDTCTPEGVCESVGVEPGEAGNAGEGSCPTGVCQTDATCGLSVYSHVYGDPQSAWQHQAISEVFAGEDAPPFTGIREVVPLPTFGSLLVFTDEGGQNVVHARGPDGGWFPPVQANAYLPGLPTDIRCGYAFQSDADVAEMALLLSGPGPGLQQAYIYTVTASGGVTPDAGNPYDVDRTDEGGSPPPNSDLCRFSFSVQTGFLGDPSWVIAWDGTGPNVYHFDGGSAVWTNYGVDTTSPIWTATGAGPAGQSVVAGWFENNQVYLVAP